MNHRVIWRAVGALAAVALATACGSPQNPQDVVGDRADVVRTDNVVTDVPGDIAADVPADIATDTTGCAAPMMMCGTNCVNTQTDMNNCGACGTSCMAGQTCTGGMCMGSMCPTGQTNCSGACVNTQTDPANCGACGTACTSMQTCATGMCRASMMCTGGQMDCGGTCVDTNTSATNCGACGRACATGESCMGGSCVLAMCPTGQMRCGTACVDTQTDLGNCGACGRACTAMQMCMAGTCVDSCAAPRMNCMVGMMTVCTDTRTDINNCGMCGRACSGGQVCNAGTCGCAMGRTACGATCVDTMTDNANCGSCGRACPSGQTCTAGACACPAPLTLCGGMCTLTSIDTANCGTCGRVCPTGQACVGGMCMASACPRPQISCGGMCINPTTDNNNCGGCGVRCGGATTCQGSVCRPANDLQANATTITLGAAETTVRGSTGNSLRDGAASMCGCTSAGNVWYRFTLARRSVVYFDTAGSSFDTSLFITDMAGTAVPAQPQNGAALPGLCNDDSGCGAVGGFTSNLQSRTAGVLAAGTYLLSLGGCSTGDFTLHAQVIPDNSGSYFYADRFQGNATVATVLVGTSAASGTCGGTASGEDVRWIMTCGQPQFMSLCQSDGGTYTRRIGTVNYDPSMYIRSGQTGAQVVCNDDGTSMGGTNCQGTGGDMFNYGSRINNVAVPRGIASVFVDERIGGSGMRYTLRYAIR